MKHLVKKHFHFSKKDIGIFFLGVGLTMFILNLSSVLNVLPYIELIEEYVSYPLLGYYVSIFSSIILMTYSLYNIHEAK